MRVLKGLGFLAFVLLTACASPARQTETLLRAPGDIPPRAALKDVPHVVQPVGYCGPSALVNALTAAGRPVSIDEVRPMVMSEKQNGTLPIDLQSAIRRLGMMAVPVEELDVLVREVAAGRSVIVFQNLGLSWAPRWHYANVVGYDLPKQEIILHSGDRAFRTEPMRWFERSWALADFWALMVLKPGEIARHAGEIANLKAAVGLEQTGRLTEAAKAYAAILKEWPGSLGAMIGAGNVAYAQKDFSTAVTYLQRATRAHPDSVVARHNLEIARRAGRL